MNSWLNSDTFRPPIGQYYITLGMMLLVPWANEVGAVIDSVVLNKNLCVKCVYKSRFRSYLIAKFV